MNSQRNHFDGYNICFEREYYREMFFEKHDTEGSQENIEQNFREGGDYNTSNSHPGVLNIRTNQQDILAVRKDHKLFGYLFW